MSGERQHDAPHGGGEVLARLSSEMVSMHKRFFGKGPRSAKSYFLDDLLIIVMRGGTTVAERTMVEFDREAEVRSFRQAFEDEMTGRLTGMVEEVTGRKVVNYQSQVMFDPDLVVEMFVFDETLPEEARRATGEGQVHGEHVGEAREDGLEPPAESGQ